MTELIYTRDYAELSQLAADRMYRTVTANPRAVLVLATGGSPQLAYRLFCNQVTRDGVDLSGVTFVKLDEWLGLSADDEATCEIFLRREILEPLGIPEKQFLHFDPEAPDAQAECDRFQAAYDALPQVDLVILGIGKNGHLGLNEPGEHLVCNTHIIPLSQKTKTHEMLTHTSAQVTHGITMGMSDLFRGKEILLLATGGEKAHLLPLLTNQQITTQIPFTLLKLHPNCTCIVDRSSFSSETYN